MDDCYIDDLEAVDPAHFWFRAKQEYLRQVIGDEYARIVDIGAGSGVNLLDYVERGYEVWAVDVSDRALEVCRDKGFNTVRVDLQESPLPSFVGRPDYITALDVLEHVARPLDVLRNLRDSSSRDTKLIVTVPAYQWLFSAWDVAMGHVKRYTRAALCRELGEAGWHVLRSTYIHVLPLFPAFCMRKIVEPLAALWRSRGTAEDLRFFKPSRFVSEAAYRLYYPEFQCFRAGIRVPLGLSVFAVAVPGDLKNEERHLDSIECE